MVRVRLKSLFDPELSCFARCSSTVPLNPCPRFHTLPLPLPLYARIDSPTSFPFPPRGRWQIGWPCANVDDPAQTHPP